MTVNINICKCLLTNLANMSDFQPLEVVDRGSETQPQVVENLNIMTIRDKDKSADLFI